MSFQTVFLAALASLAIANAHVIMKSPVPYSVEKLDNSPISKSQYPCKSQNGFTVSTMNAMAVGEKQTLKLFGQAVHGGGSCQLSVSLDTEPTASSVFKVIKSMEGGCPGVDGEAKSYDFELPASIPNGKATFAWTWNSKLSGLPELYMNCAPIEVTGGASDNTAFNALPDMLAANLDDSCESVANSAVQYPNPGQTVEMGGTADLKAPVGSSCGSTSGTTPAVSSAPDGEAPGAPTSPAAGQSSTAAASPSAAPYNPGGVFAPGASSAAPIPSSAVPIPSSAAPIPSNAAPLPSTKTTLITVTASPSAAKPSSTGGATPAQPTAPAAGGNKACSEEGAIMCNGTSQFGLCNNGQITWQAVAPGTTCSNGVIGRREYTGRIARPRIVGSRIAVSGMN